MRYSLRKALYVLATSAITAAASVQAQDHREQFTAVTPTNFDRGDEVSRQFHLNAGSYLPMTLVPRLNPARELPTLPWDELAHQPVEYRGGTTAFADYVANDPMIDGIVLVYEGRIVFEAYPNMKSWQRHFAWSVTKVITSTALAVLAEQGQVAMDAKVGAYVDQLVGTAWDGVTVQQVADMASGINCLDSDGYQDNTTCIYRLEESLGLVAPSGSNPELLQHLASMELHREPGSSNEYVSANTIVLMLIIEAVRGESFADTLQELLWTPMGAEADGLMAISEDGYAIAHGGLSARLRDIARFGLLLTEAGPDQMIKASTLTRMRTGGVPVSDTMVRGIGAAEDDRPLIAAWQWDAIWADGGMYKSGYLGQGIYIDPERELVVAWFGTGSDFGAEQNELLPVTRQLARSGLFAKREIPVRHAP
ncbi:MAG: serine hydrolase domain-containing protein [Pseudomonadota bacterium]